jgi:hypothetical protein
MRSRFFSAALLALLILPLAAQEIKLSGTVTDADGKPVAKADVSTWWSHWKGKLEPDGGVQSGADGAYTLTTELEGSIPPALLVMDAARTQGAVVQLEKAAQQKVDVKLAPLANVHGRFECPDMGIPFDHMVEGLIRLQPAGAPFMQFGAEDKAFSILLPAGKYSFGNSSMDTLVKEYPFSVVPRVTDVDMDRVELSPTPIARAYGKAPPPLTLTGVRNGPEDLTLAKLKGKHVLVIFWAFW